MRLISIQEEAELLKNLLSDPDDWISARILRLHDENEAKSAAGEGESESDRIRRQPIQKPQ